MPDHYQFSNSFYLSPMWRRCRSEYLRSVGGLCENCLKAGIYTPAYEVHHIKRITEDNIDDPSITLNPSNLMALCKDCHIKEHRWKRWRTDGNGHVEL